MVRSDLGIFIIYLLLRSKNTATAVPIHLKTSCFFLRLLGSSSFAATENIILLLLLPVAEVKIRALGCRKPAPTHHHPRRTPLLIYGRHSPTCSVLRGPGLKYSRRRRRGRVCKIIFWTYAYERIVLLLLLLRVFSLPIFFSLENR